MSAQPIEAYEPRDPRDLDDPVEILRILPKKYHGYFVSDYEVASRAAALNPERFRDLRGLLRLWRLRALAYSAPGYEDRLAAALEGRTENSAAAEDLIPDWPTT